MQNEKVMIIPKELKRQFPLGKDEEYAVIKSRRTIADIIHGHDPRLLIVCGPCSIHDTNAALDYAYRLKALSDELNDQLYIIMRVYFEKPRTTIGWKGLINDPYMNGSFDIEAGLRIARDLLIKLIRIGIPLATEVLDLNSPQYLGDLFSWSAIGARTTEAQTHREMASGLSMPVGFKNSTDGSLATAINAVHVASISHRFMSINQDGRICMLRTCGNPDGHIILRGGKQPNYHAHNIADCEQKMAIAGLTSALIIDCSHGNSNKNYRQQVEVVQSIIKQIKSGNCSIIGLMLESYIHAGNQSSEIAYNDMLYGVSVTDGCIDWKDTDILLRQLYSELITVLPLRQAKRKALHTKIFSTRQITNIINETQ